MKTTTMSGDFPGPIRGYASAKKAKRKGWQLCISLFSISLLLSGSLFDQLWLLQTPSSHPSYRSSNFLSSSPFIPLRSRTKTFFSKDNERRGLFVCIDIVGRKLLCYVYCFIIRHSCCRSFPRDQFWALSLSRRCRECEECVNGETSISEISVTIRQSACCDLQLSERR